MRPFQPALSLLLPIAVALTSCAGQIDSLSPDDPDDDAGVTCSRTPQKTSLSPPI